MPAGTIGFRATGKLRRGEPVEVLLPPLHAAIERDEPLRILLEVAPGFQEFPAAAVVRDMKAAAREELRDRSRWRRVALVTEVGWLVGAAKVLGFMAPGELRIFAPGEAGAARAWLAA